MIANLLSLDAKDLCFSALDDSVDRPASCPQRTDSKRQQTGERKDIIKIPWFSFKIVPYEETSELSQPGEIQTVLKQDSWLWLPFLFCEYYVNLNGIDHKASYSGSAPTDFY